jgi:hypothetical protein
MSKNIEIIGGGTVSHVRNHLALTAPAYGNTARAIFDYRYQMYGSDGEHDVHLHLTKMANAGQGNLETNEDVSKLVDELIANPETKVIFFNPALVDYTGQVEIYDDKVGTCTTPSGKYETRLKTSEGERTLFLRPAAKILGKIRKTRKDIFLVAFKTTCGATEDEQFLTGLHLLKTNSCNLVLANDTKTRVNMIITPEQARYSVTTNRAKVINELVTMTMARSTNTFTRSTVVSGPTIPWDMENVPHALKAVVEHCIAKGAYKPFNGATVGHFAFKVNDKTFITSKRKVNFNQLKDVGMVMCTTANGDNEVIAYGAKPSVGGQSQRIIFREHPETDCIVHFHCPPKPTAYLSVREQKLFECGSHQCGSNTSDGLREAAPGIKCVYLDNHGPNIVFNHETNPKEIIEFIDKNFDLSRSTDQVNGAV